LRISSIARRGVDRTETAEAVAQRLLWDMSRYAGVTARTDDVTLIVAKIL